MKRYILESIIVTLALLFFIGALAFAAFSINIWLGIGFSIFVTCGFIALVRYVIKTSDDYESDIS
jgi:phosphoglycerol transferase MdoB-like AlkP superfamily enzyme